MTMTSTPAANGIYKLDPALWEKNRRRTMRMFLAMPAGVILIAAVRTVQRWKGPDFHPVFDLTYILVTAAIVLGCGYLFVRKHLARANMKYHSFTLFVDEHELRRQQLFVPELRIPFSAITSIRKVQGQGALISSRGNPRLWIPDELLGYESVCATLRLNTSQYSETKKGPLPSRIGLLPAYVAAIVTMLMTDNTGIMVATGILSTVYMASLWVFAMRSAGAERRERMLSGGMTLLAAIVFLTRLWSLLHGTN